MVLSPHWRRLLPTSAKGAGERLTLAARKLQIAIAGIDSKGRVPNLA
jgi:hypothetical protein